MEIVAAVLAILAFAAFIVEATVEYTLGTAFDKLTEKYPKFGGWKWTLMYPALGLGVLVAYTFSFDMFALLGQEVGYPIDPSVLGWVLTGLAIGRGSNFVNDIRDKFFRKESLGR